MHVLPYIFINLTIVLSLFCSRQVHEGDSVESGHCKYPVNADVCCVVFNPKVLVENNVPLICCDSQIPRYSICIRRQYPLQVQ